MSLVNDVSNQLLDRGNFFCGYVAIVGRPNVGKSTLLNKLLGQKISITARKPQTTRHRILGIKTDERAQVIYVDTPGIHGNSRVALNRYMNRAATSSLQDVDVILFVIEASTWNDQDEYVLNKLSGVEAPVILVLNKLDKIKEKENLLLQLEKLAGKMNFAQLIPVSARSGEGLEALEKAVIGLLPPSEPFFPEDQITDRSERFLAAEFIREKLMRSLGEEVPYALTVEIERFEDQGNLKNIQAVIWVARPGHKGIVIGKGGSLLKGIGEQARKDMEQAFDCKVFLQLWVKVKEGWADDERALRSLGYYDD
ncbi:MAG: GTPase Era [Gammaproteobacteria bacterium]|nr:GTPase Era [Gammaproteobacteria bacterium]